MPNIKLVGFSKEKADELIPRIAEEIREKTGLASEAVITYYPSTCMSVADITKPMSYFCICNTGGDAIEEFEELTEVLKPFGFDIEWGDIKEFFPALGFKEGGAKDSLTEEQVLDALSEKFGVPKIDLGEMVPNPGIVELVETEVIRRHKVLPIKLEGNELVVAMVNPLNLMAIDDIRLATGYDVQPRVCSEKAIDARIQELFGTS